MPLLTVIKCLPCACLLDLSVAFDTVDHDLLMLRLYRHFGPRGVVLQCFGSYICLAERFKSSTAPVRHQLSRLHVPYHKVQCSVRDAVKLLGVTLDSTVSLLTNIQLMWFKHAHTTCAHCVTSDHCSPPTPLRRSPLPSSAPGWTIVTVYFCGSSARNLVRWQNVENQFARVVLL